MKNDSGITRIAFPFAAGVAAAGIAGQAFTGALCASAGVAVLTALCCRSRGRCTLAVGALFAVLGALCRWSSDIAGPPPELRLPGSLLDPLILGIDAAGFPGQNSEAIITALLTGRRSGLPRTTVETFRRSGAAHILALSGMHLGVIYLFIGRLLSPIGNSPAARWTRGTASICLCGIYTLATGAGPSICRAFIFIVINEIRKACSGRRSSPLSTWCTAITLQLALSPTIIGSVGFQLSYAAMLGITLVYPVLESWYPPGPGLMGRIWKTAALSISCQLFTAPICWWHFRSLPGYFLIANIISLPLSEAIIILALCCLLLEGAGLHPQALATVCGRLVELLEKCLETVASM